MKKIIFIILLALTSTSVSTFQSCSSTSDLSRSNIGTVESSLLNMLTTKLGLNTTQIPLVSNLLKIFLNNKLSIVGLAKTNPSAYSKQLIGLQNSLRGSLAEVFIGKQLNSFNALKPPFNDSKNNLSYLFY